MSPRKPSWDLDDAGWEDWPPVRDQDDPPWPAEDAVLNQVVLKFGGTSVTGLGGWQTIEAQLRELLAAGERPLVVCSALSGVSDLLVRLADGYDGGEVQALLLGLRKLHIEQSAELGLAVGLVGDLLEELERLIEGARLVGELSPRVRARVLSAGELLCTRLGAAWLRTRGLTVARLDARELLDALPCEDPLRHYTDARCAWEPDIELQSRLAAMPEQVLLTQGFIARDERGDTVLLGRGGSDTSAATLAARLAARRLEIWSDVPGMFTADPRVLPSARLLRRLDYDEAQELATMGAKVLHPRCLAPLRATGIPLDLRCTAAPGAEGTRIRGARGGHPRVKAISARSGIVLVSMDTVGMWQQVGFLAEVFQAFARAGLSVDMVATSETNVTVSLDPRTNDLSPSKLQALVADLRPHCRASVIGPAASVSLVGRSIRSVLHQLGPVLERFEDRQVHLLTQAASDLNLSFVVEQDQAAGVLVDLHAQLFSGPEDELLGPSWARLSGEQDRALPKAWWAELRDELLELAGQGTPAYVSSRRELRRAAQRLLDLGSVDRILFAMKSNPHPEILRLFEGMGLGFECVSPGELARLQEVFGGLPQGRVLFTPNFAPAADYQAGFDAGAMVTLDSLYPLEHWPELFRGRELVVRLDPGRGDGHHAYVITAGRRSKFGIPGEDLPRLFELVGELDLRIVGLHCHAGSGVKTPQTWRDKAVWLKGIAAELPQVRFLDLGGGLPVPDRPGMPSLDLSALDAGLANVRGDYELWLEPGRFLVASACALLTRVSQVKTKGGRHFVGVDAGMHTLIRPALYGAWHEIVNLSRLGQEPALQADVVGPICETGDVLGYQRLLPLTVEGDVLLVDNAGAYGAAMSSDYNLRPRALELFLD